jgi:DNA-binding transcriptional MerR regulator
VRISELARRCGASARSLRHYDARGLLDSTRSPNGYRDFAEPAVEQVRRIRSLLAVGLDLDEIAVLLPCFGEDGRLGGCETARRRLAERIAAVDHALADLRRTRARLVAEVERW